MILMSGSQAILEADMVSYLLDSHPVDLALKNYLKTAVSLHHPGTMALEQPFAQWRGHCRDAFPI